MANPRSCPLALRDMAEALAADLPGYLMRAYARLGNSVSVLVASYPELEPLPVVSGAPLDPAANDANASPPQDGQPRQVFLTVLERRPGDRDYAQRAYWLFVVYTQRGWRLDMAFTRIGNAPPQDASDGVLAGAARTWFRDRCGGW